MVMKRMLGFALVLIAAWGIGCTSSEPEKVQAIKFVPQEEEAEVFKKPSR